jgi:hypothetical protein
LLRGYSPNEAKMLSIEIPVKLEKQFWHVVQDSYQGDIQKALMTFLYLHEKYGAKEQLLRDVQAVRSEVKKRGGITQKKIAETVHRYRKGALNG